MLGGATPRPEAKQMPEVHAFRKSPRGPCLEKASRRYGDGKCELYIRAVGEYAKQMLKIAWTLTSGTMKVTMIYPFAATTALDAATFQYKFNQGHWTRSQRPNILDGSIQFAMASLTCPKETQNKFADPRPAGLKC